MTNDEKKNGIEYNVFEFDTLFELNDGLVKYYEGRTKTEEGQEESSYMIEKKANIKIEKIVFIKWWSEEKNEEISDAHVFFQDGTEQRMNMEDGKMAVFNYAEQRGFKSIEELKFCKNIIFLTKEEFEKRYKEFKPK